MAKKTKLTSLQMLGAKLKELRLEAGLSMRDMEALTVDPKTGKTMINHPSIVLIEKGKNVEWKTIEKWAEVCGYSIDTERMFKKKKK